MDNDCGFNIQKRLWVLNELGFDVAFLDDSVRITPNKNCRFLNVKPVEVTAETSQKALFKAHHIILHSHYEVNPECPTLYKPNIKEDNK